ncbi:MAG: DEAD/DEAH box helicase, partial [Bacteriovoracaceae bacterium]|nr:DEAD/DEAH box helicase [Bacteriovoracaceae bacterium]
MSDFKSLDLLPTILTALNKKGYTTPTPIQGQSIPHLLKGKDLLGIAQTGTGKTAAFSLPIINRLAKNKVKAKPARVRTLILTPTRELASQIEENIKLYSKGLNLKTTVIFGGVGHRPQIQSMSRGVDILIATPGRLLDLMSDGHVLYEQLEVFVLDEADRMLNMGFINDVKKIISKLPKKKQTLLFSATMPKDIANLANSLLKNPVKVEVTPESKTVDKIDQKINLVEKANKPLLLKSILQDQEVKSVLVFTRTKHGADRVVKNLTRSSIEAAAIHGNKSQGARERALGSFRSGQVRVLVATDIAARGIDVSHVTHVINYD